MKANGQIPAIIQYVTDHPGCYLTDIIRATKVPKCSATAALSNLTKSHTLRRAGFEKRYRYYVVHPEDRPVTAPKRQPKQLKQNTPNPLNNLFNQCLASVRGGRAEV